MADLWTTPIEVAVEEVALTFTFRLPEMKERAAAKKLRARMLGATTDLPDKPYEEMTRDERVRFGVWALERDADVVPEQADQIRPLIQAVSNGEKELTETETVALFGTDLLYDHIGRLWWECFFRGEALRQPASGSGGREGGPDSGPGDGSEVQGLPDDVSG